MFRLVCISLIATLVVGQFQFPDRIREWLQGLGGVGTIDTIHGFTVQYLDQDDIFLFRDSDDCYIVPATSERWDALLDNEQALHTFVDGVYAQIQSGSGVTHITQHDASEQYHSRIEEFECIRHDVYVLNYHAPSSN